MHQRHVCCSGAASPGRGRAGARTTRAATAASRAAEAPPALLAAGVDAGKRNGVIAPRPTARAGPEALDPPRGGSAAPPPARWAGCHWVEMP